MADDINNPQSGESSDNSASQNIATPVQDIQPVGTPTFPQPASAGAAAVDIAGPSQNPNGTAKKSKIGLIVGLIIGAVVLIGGIIALVLVLVLSGVSQEDYKTAYDQVVALRSDSNDKISALNDAETSASTSGDQQKTQEATDAIKNLRSLVKSNVDKIGELKAVTNDKDAKAKFDKLHQASRAYVDNLDAAGNYVAQVLPVVAKMNSVGSLNPYDDTDRAKYISTLNDIATDLKKVNVNDSVNEHTKALATDLTNLASHVESAVANGDTTQLLKDASAMTKDANALDGDLTDLLNDNNTTKAYQSAVDDLGKYLSSKIK